MKITTVRNATLLVDLDGRRVLVDPMLGAKGSLAPFPAASGNTERNPTVELGRPLADLLDPDVVVVTHTHADHWDAAAAALLPRGVPVLTQHRADADLVAAQGFTDVRVLDSTVTVGRTRFERTEGRHAGDDVWDEIGPVIGSVMGVVVRHPGEPTLYVAGDTVWTDDVRAALVEHRPDVVVVNTGEARIGSGAGMKILMGLDDLREVCRVAPDAQIVAVHMEALNHCTVTRAEVEAFARAEGVSGRVVAPRDGALLTF